MPLEKEAEHSLLRRPDRRQVWAVLWSGALVLGLGLTLAELTRAEQLLEMIMGANLRWTLIGLTVFLGAHALRAVRLKLLLAAEKIPLARAWCWSGLHAVWTYLLPVRTGEASLVLYLRRHEGVCLSRGTALVVTVRALEVGWTVLVVPFTIVALQDYVGSESTSYVIGAAVVAALGITLLGWVIASSRFAPDRVRSRVSPNGLADKLLTVLGSFRANIRSFVQHENRESVLALTLTIWLLNFVVFYVMFRIVGLSVPLGAVLVILIGMSAVQVVPVQGLANLGSHELVWVPVLKAAGFDLSTAMSIGVATHVLYALFVSFFALLLLGSRWRVEAGSSRVAR